MECKIISLGKRRNGKPKWWCSVHKRFAWDEKGNKMEHCPGYFEEQQEKELKELTLNVDEYLGGVGIWGFLHPIFDTTHLPSPKFGVHVHARRSVDSRKEIDTTYDKVCLIRNGERVICINGKEASAYTLSRTAGFKPTIVKCTHCGALHTDEGYLAVFPHIKHWCENCGHDFFVNERNIGNKLASLEQLFPEYYYNRTIIPANRHLKLSIEEYPGGIRIWASNPALLWTAPRPEESGIHVHAYDEKGNKVIDETYTTIEINGVKLDQQEVRYYMAQVNVPEIKNRVASLKCPKCGHVLFDKGEEAFIPRSTHKCPKCGHEFKYKKERKTKLISNPIVDKLERLKNMF